MLAVERLVVRYGPRTALDSVNVEFTPDRVIALTGPNGSGKSTLIQAIAGLIRPVSGRILWKGTDTTGCIHRDIGVLLQRPVLLAGSVKTNVEYGLKLRKIPHRERRTRVRDALTAVGALDLLHRSRRSLSGGEIQRVALARTLALNPSCLMLDEPFAHLDRAGIQALSAILTRLHGQGILLIIATHQEMPGHALGAHIVALQHGRIAVPEIRNVLRGTSYTTNNRRFLRLDTGIVLEHTEPVEGDAAFILDPGAVILARHPLQSSARNSLPGRITGLHRDGSRIRASIDCGTFFDVYITDTSLAELSLGIDTPVEVTFKASALRWCRVGSG